MIRNSAQAVIHWLKRVVTQPLDELDRWQRAARFAYDLGRYGGKQLRHDRAPQMAAALAFRSLFALLPVLVVATVLIKAVRGTAAFLELTRELLAATGLADIRVISPTELGTGPAAESLSLAQWLEGLVGQAAAVNLAAVGWIGVAVIIYAAIGLMVTIEISFNTIYRAPEGRAWSRRIPLYWFILTVGPVALGATWYLNTAIADWVDSVAGWQQPLVLLSVGWNLLFAWLFLLAVYALIPNTAVALRPAMLGALVATVLLEIGKRFLGAYLENAFAISQLYGSLGLIPLFMFWVYLMWLVVLFGLEVSATLQMLRGRHLQDLPSQRAATGLIEPAAVLTTMELVAERFAAGLTTTARWVADATNLPETVVAAVLERLLAAGLLHRVAGEPTAVSLARPPEQIEAERLIEIGFDLVDEAQPGRQSVLREPLRRAQKELLEHTTLAALIATGAPGGR